MVQLPLGIGSMARRLLPWALGGAAVVAPAAALWPRLTLSAPGGSAVTTRSYDLGRTGWNRHEPVLSPATVGPQTFHRLGELRVGGPIEASPLYVPHVNTTTGTRDLLLVAVSNNVMDAFDAGTRDKVWTTNLGEPPEELAFKGTDAVYRWGITATPVVDTDTGIVYVVRAALEGNANPRDKVYRLYGLHLSDGTEAITSQAVDGFSVKRGSKFFKNSEQIIRTALALWRNPAGDKAVIFGASGGEGNGANGWVIAYSVASLSAGGSVTPAVWCSTPNGGGGGVWMASQGVAVDEDKAARDIYFSTGNGPYQQLFGADDLGESVVRLHYDPATNTLETVNWFTPFQDFDANHNEDHRDQDLGAAGVLLIPGAETVLAGGKEGIFYNIKRSAMGKTSHADLLQPDFVATFTPPPGSDYLTNPNHATTTDGATNAAHGAERTFFPQPADGGRTRHIHGSAVYFENGPQRLVYVMGENSTLRAFSYDGTKLGTTPIAQSSPDTAASGGTPPPGAMPGGFLTVSSADATGTNGIVWSLSPRKSLWRDPVAVKIPGQSILRAFTAVPNPDGSITQLWNSELDLRDAVGSASKFQPPLVADGKVYVVTYDNKVLIYGTTPPRQTVRDIRRTMILINAHTQLGQDLFVRGGIDHAFGTANGRDCPTSVTPAYEDARYYNCAVRIEHRNPLNYGTPHEQYPVTNRWQVNDAYLDWYGAEERQVYQRKRADGVNLGPAQGTPLDWTTNAPTSGDAVVRNGFGFLKENFDAALGADYWMLDVDMDCESAITVGGVAWFELKSYLTNVADEWEPDVNQSDRPYASNNHFGKCGKINIFERGTGTVSYLDFDTVHQCSLPDVERRCNGSHAQVCRLVAGARLWQDDQDCVQSAQLCQVSTGVCCSAQTGDGTNQNCF
ncbi:MAG: hypothetical protein ABI895_33315 [Deltaproteobacteria bacterium]